MALAAPDGIKASATVRCYCWGFAGAFRSISCADLTLLTGVLMFGLGHRGTSIASAGYRIAQDNPSRTEMPDFVRRDFDARRVWLSKLQLPVGRLSPDSRGPRARRLSRMRNCSRQRVPVPAPYRGAASSPRHDDHGLLKFAQTDAVVFTIAEVPTAECAISCPPGLAEEG
jgi:hypothetical protein